MYDAVMAETVRIGGHGRDQIEAYLARPLNPGPVGGVVVIHHLPGYDELHKQITTKFGAHGYLAICPNLYSRQGFGLSPDDAAAAARAAGGLPDEQVVGDVDGAVQYLRSLTNSNGTVGVIGYCSGGRHAFLAACSRPLDAAVDCYGAFIVGEPPPQLARLTPLVQLTPQLSGPLLGLFGNDDTHPSPAEVNELERVLTGHGKSYEFYRYDGAGHAFFNTDRPSYRPQAALDGWAKVFDFFGRHLAG